MRLAATAGLRRTCWAWAAAVLLWSPSALAQNDPFGRGLGGPGAGGPPAQQQQSQKQQQQQQGPPGAPEQHAASGGGESLIPETGAPTLPEKPLKVKKAVKQRIGSDAAGIERRQGMGVEVDRDYYGLWYNEESGDYRFRTLFPLWVERTQPSLVDPRRRDRASLFGGFYYNRRSATRADDILFPLIWNLRDTESRTTVVGPVVNRIAPGERHDWLAPLYFHGTTKTSGYNVIPPLLTWTTYEKNSGLNIAALAFCTWEGGQDCDVRTARTMKAGVAPFWFYGHNELSSFHLIPPLLSYTAVNERHETTLDVWGGIYYRKHTPKWDSLHLFPLYYSVWADLERHTTVLPLFHYGYERDAFLLVTPLFVQRRGEKGDVTHANWLYARHRGRTELDMFTPLLWLYRDEDVGLDQKFFFPFYFSRQSPREDTLVVFPFYANSKRFAISESTWVTPLFRYAHGLTGWDVMLHPLFYAGRDGRDEHLVLPPLYFDFKSVDSRSTVFFPLFWRFDKPTLVSQLIGNVYVESSKSRLSKNWEAHIFPLVSFGETQTGHWWKILYGLIGYERRGPAVQVHAFWIPFGDVEE